MALLAMDQYGLLLAAICPAARPVANLEAAARVARRGRLPILLASGVINGERRLERTFRLTSDSIAAHLARRTGARRLVLVKSARLPTQRVVDRARATSLARRGIVDPLFPALMPRRAETWIVNGRRSKEVAKFLATVAIVSAVGCGPALESASAGRLNEAEAAWRAASIHGYRITVEVARVGDRRRSELTVHRDQIEDATVAYWDPGKGRWLPPAPLRDDQAAPFRVEGLFEMVRQEMAGGHREGVRIAIGGTPPIPRRIALGRLLQNGRPAPGSEVAVVVIRMESIPDRSP
jgi:hypothetical protein